MNAGGLSTAMINTRALNGDKHGAETVAAAAAWSFAWLDQAASSFSRADGRDAAKDLSPPSFRVTCSR
jgi:hypothetical protein